MPLPTVENIVIASSACQEVCASAKFTKRFQVAYDKLLKGLQTNSLSHGANQQLLSRGGKDNLFSFRVTGEARILAVPRQIGGRLHWVITHLFLAHDEYEAQIQHYDFSCVDKVVAEQYREAGCDAPVEDDSAAGGAAKKSVEPVVQEAGFYKGQILSATVDQRSLLKRLGDRMADDEFKAIVTGPPGSGKSYLVSQLVQLLVPAGHEVVCMAQLGALRDALQEDWLASSACNERNKERVQFVDYLGAMEIAGVLKKTKTGLQALSESGDWVQVVDDTYFESFIAKSKLEDKRQAKLDDQSGGGGGAAIPSGLLAGLTMEQIRQEFSVMVGNFTDYCRGSIFVGNQNLQEKLWHLFQEFKAEESAQSVCYLPFYIFGEPAVKTQKHYVGDEIGDCNRHWLFNIARQFSCAVMKGDDNQALTDPSQSMEWYIAHIEATYHNRLVFRLLAALRSPQIVTAVGNKLLSALGKIGRRMGGGYRQLECGVETAGFVSSESAAANLHWYTDPNTVVMCASTRVDAVAEQLDALIIGGVEDFKGLAASRVVIVDLLLSFSKVSAKRSKLILASLLNLLKGEKVSRQLMRHEHFELVQYIHHLYVAVMRSTADVHFVFTQKIPSVMKEILAILMEGSSATAGIQVGEQPQSTGGSKSDAAGTKQSDLEKWQDKYERLKKMGVAKSVLNRMLENKINPLRVAAGLPAIEADPSVRPAETVTRKTRAKKSSGAAVKSPHKAPLAVKRDIKANFLDVLTGEIEDQKTVNDYLSAFASEKAQKALSSMNQSYLVAYCEKFKLEINRNSVLFKLLSDNMGRLLIYDKYPEILFSLAQQDGRVCKMVELTLGEMVSDAQSVFDFVADYSDDKFNLLLELAKVNKNIHTRLVLASERTNSVLYHRRVSIVGLGSADESCKILIVRVIKRKFEQTLGLFSIEKNSSKVPSLLGKLNCIAKQHISLRTDVVAIGTGLMDFIAGSKMTALIECLLSNCDSLRLNYSHVLESHNPITIILKCLASIHRLPDDHEQWSDAQELKFSSWCDSQSRELVKIMKGTDRFRPLHLGNEAAAAELERQEYSPVNLQELRFLRRSIYLLGKDDLVRHASNMLFSPVHSFFNETSGPVLEHIALIGNSRLCNLMDLMVALADSERDKVTSISEDSVIMQILATMEGRRVLTENYFEWICFLANKSVVIKNKLREIIFEQVENSRLVIQVIAGKEKSGFEQFIRIFSDDTSVMAQLLIVSAKPDSLLESKRDLIERNISTSSKPIASQHVDSIRALMRSVTDALGRVSIQNSLEDSALHFEKALALMKCMGLGLFYFQFPESCFNFVITHEKYRGHLLFFILRSAALFARSEEISFPGVLSKVRSIMAQRVKGASNVHSYADFKAHTFWCSSIRSNLKKEIEAAHGLNLHYADSDNTVRVPGYNRQVRLLEQRGVDAGSINPKKSGGGAAPAP